jgi:hypothetical protein
LYFRRKGRKLKKGFIDALSTLTIAIFSIAIIAGVVWLVGSNSSHPLHPIPTLSGKWDFTVLIKGEEIDFSAIVVQSSATSVTITSSTTIYGAKLKDEQISFLSSTSNATITFFGTVSKGKAEMNGSVEIYGYLNFDKKQKVFNTINGVWFAVKTK